MNTAQPHDASTSHSVPAAVRAPAGSLALIATFAALIAVLALTPAIAVGGIAVPITLQTLGVMLAGAVLGARRGALATLLYIVVGLAGVPIFAQFTGGLSVLAAPSAGYLLSFPLAAFIIGTLAARVPHRGKIAPAAAMIGAVTAGAISVYPAGIAVMAWRTGMTLSEAFMVNLTFVP
ncbi:MAG TPA: biotin transporter BioY, partial [Actinomycetales bacterium]|nr:biotin transporter BioY [Actinomycetales bacterium]